MKSREWKTIIALSVVITAGATFASASAMQNLQDQLLRLGNDSLLQTSGEEAQQDSPAGDILLPAWEEEQAVTFVGMEDIPGGGDRRQ